MKKTFLLTLLFVCSASFAVPIFKADFSRDFNRFRPYAGIAPKLENGKLYLESGTQFTVGLPEPGRYLLKAKISGGSNVQMMVFGGPKNASSLKLEGAGELSLSYYESGKALNAAIITQNKTPFFLEDLTVESVPLLEVENAEIDARAFELEDFPGVNGWTRTDSSARNGSYRSGQNWYRPVMDLPVPRTSKPLYLYLRARRQGTEPAIIYVTAGRQPVLKTKVNSDAFAWVKIGPINARELTPTISMEIAATPKLNVDIDTAVWSTNSTFQSANLDKVKSENLKQALVSAFPVSNIKIDGLADEAGWKSAVALTPFRIEGTSDFAKEQTSVKLGYDAEHLFVFFHAQESALDPSNQRLHDFKKALSQPDVKKCYNDDVVLLLIQRKGNSGMYEFVANASGIVTTTTCAEPDYWRTRKTADASGIRAAGTVGNGFYNVEIAIPFTALGGIPKNDDDFRILLGRVEHSQEENSVFAAERGGFHRPENLIPLRFSKRANGTEIIGMPSFHSGDNKIDFRNGKALFITSLETMKNRENFISEDGTFMISQSGEFQFFCGMYDPITLSPLMRFQPLRTRTRSSLLDFRPIQGTEVNVNGIKATAGIPLASGTNAIAVSGENAKQMKFKVDKNEIAIDSTWKQTNGTYQKLLLLEHSRLWPDWTKEGVTIMSGEIQQIQFPPLPPQGMKTSDLEFHVELPEGFSFEGASGYYKKYRLTISQNDNVPRDGKKYNRYTIHFDNELTWSEKLPSHEYVVFAIRAPKTQVAKEERFFFHTSSASLSMEEIPNECKVYVIPAVQSKTPEKIHVQLWPGWLKNLDDSTLLKKILGGIKNSGYNEISVKNDQGITYFTNISFVGWNLSTKPFLKTVPGNELIRFRSGKKDSNYTCPTAICTEAFAKWLENAIPEWFERWGKPAIVCMDYEGGIFDSDLACACPKCLARFTRQYGLPENISTEEIQKKHASQWCDFMTSQMADVIKQLYTALKQCTPQPQFYVYSGYECEHTKYSYGVDWKKIAPYMDFGGAGYGRPQAEVDATVEACNPKPVIMGVIVYPDSVDSRLPPTIASAAELMDAMHDSNGGILIYAYPTLDGRSFAAQAEVSRIVAENEAFFAPGSFCDAQGEVTVSGCEYFARKDRKENLLLVFTNRSHSQTNCRFSFHKPGKMTDCKTGQPTQAKEVSIPAGGIAVYRLDI